MMATAEALGMTSPGGAWAGGDEPEPAVAARTPWQLFWERFREDRLAFVSLGFIGFEIVAALSAPLIVRVVGHPPNAQYPSALDPSFGTPTGPSRTFLFGVDSVGEDVFSRVLYGARVSLEVALIATALSVVIGVALGMVAGYYRGATDTLISRVIDVTLAFPILLLALGIASACSLGGGCLGGLIKPGLSTVIVAIVVINWTYIGRVIRGEVLSLREKEFVCRSPVRPSGDRRILGAEGSAGRRHVLGLGSRYGGARVHR
jgi:peptide/nickel transport system permease protein